LNLKVSPPVAMVNSNFVKPGRLVRIIRGPRTDKVGVVTDIIDSNRVLISNPEDKKMWLHVQNLANLEPLKFSVAIKRGAKCKEVKEALAAKKTLAKYEKTTKARKIAAASALANSTDFERYQLIVARRVRSNLARKLFDESDKKDKLSWHSKTAAKLERNQKKYVDKRMKARHARIKAYFTKKTAKKQAKGKKPAAKKPAAKKTARKPSAAFMKAMKPSSALAKVVGDKPLPRTEVVKKVWVYIKKNGLQDKKDKRSINADDNLRAVFGGKKSVSMFEMTKLLSNNLS